MVLKNGEIAKIEDIMIKNYLFGKYKLNKLGI